MRTKAQRSKRKNTTPIKGTKCNTTSCVVGEPSDVSEGVEMEASVVQSENMAALTAKNYRLAKELNELRTKHKDETKQVSELTLQNMNLASRCRQAINHVESLRKELAKYQKKCPEVVASKDINLNRRPSYSIRDTGSQPVVRNEENRIFGRPLVTPNNAPQDNNIAGSSQLADEVDSNIICQVGVDETKGMNVDVEHSYILSQEMETHKQTDSFSTELSTPPPVTPDADNEQSTDDKNSKFIVVEDDESPNVAFGELRSKDYFYQTYENTLPATPEKENVDIDAMNKQFDSFNNLKVNDTNSVKKEKVGNIDAFEASFQTTFPASFADSRSPSKFGETEFSDSFFMESTCNANTETSTTNDHIITSSPVDERILESLRKNSGIPTGEVDDAPMDEVMGLFPKSPMEIFETFDTPLKESNEISSCSSKSTAMARFERKQRKVGPTNATQLDEVQTDSTDHRSTLVLQKLQQRKANSNSSSFSSNSNQLLLSEESRKLDEIAKGIPTSREKKNRRNVSRPTSYAEPSLNSKLRRGDVFFPKENSSILNYSNDIRKDSIPSTVP